MYVSIHTILLYMYSANDIWRLSYLQRVVLIMCAYSYVL
jgi:hypothetical protein